MKVWKVFIKSILVFVLGAYMKNLTSLGSLLKLISWFQDSHTTYDISRCQFRFNIFFFFFLRVSEKFHSFGR